MFSDFQQLVTKPVPDDSTWFGELTNETISLKGNILVLWVFGKS